MRTSRRRAAAASRWAVIACCLKWHLALSAILLRGRRRAGRRSDVTVAQRFGHWRAGRRDLLVRLWLDDRGRSAEYRRLRAESSTPDPAATIERVLEHINGELSRALRLLHSADIADVDEGVLAQLRANTRSEVPGSPRCLFTGKSAEAVGSALACRLPPPPSAPPSAPRASASSTPGWRMASHGQASSLSSRTASAPGLSTSTRPTCACRLSSPRTRTWGTPFRMHGLFLGRRSMASWTSRSHLACLATRLRRYPRSTGCPDPKQIGPQRPSREQNHRGG
jgi:hypothetical protein